MSTNERLPLLTPVKRLFVFLIASLIGSFILVVGYSWYLLDIAGMFQLDLCFSFSCFGLFFGSLRGVFDPIEWLLEIIVSLVSIYVVYHALKHYMNSIHTSRANVHLNHLGVFKNYLEREVEVRNRLTIDSFDILKWYNKAFPDSNKGLIGVSKSYQALISGINKEVDSSNKIISGSDVKANLFDYRDHQKRMISALSSIGINISWMPRNDFYELETILFDLINQINLEFCCLPPREAKINDRLYN